MQVHGQSAIVTGGASGLGAGVVKRLRREGISVGILDVSVDLGEALAAETGAHFFHADVTDEQSLAKAFAGARAVQGQERILVCCAGIAAAIPVVTAGPDGIATHPFADFARVIDINLLGTFRCIAMSAAGMAAQDAIDTDGQRGVVICTGSIAAEDGSVGQTAYAASKAGIAGMVLPAARDLGELGIRVVAVHPGAFITPLLSRAPQSIATGLANDSVFPKRCGDSREFAEMVLHICHNDMVNGTTFRLDAGLRMSAAQSGLRSGGK